MNFYNLTDDEVHIIVVALTRTYLGNRNPDRVAAQKIVEMLGEPSPVRLNTGYTKAEFDHGFNTYHE